MIAFLRGRLAAKTGAHCLLDVNGVGYRIAMATPALAALPAEGEPVTILTHLLVREDELSLFGFLEDAERDLFEMLITVSGVGPKVALAVLSAMTPEALATALGAEDVAAISSVPGIGKKTAQRIIIELKDKLAAPGLGSVAGGAATPAHAEVRDALLAMGFAPAEASAALAGAEGGSAQALLKHALKRLGGA
ncbi:MAG TPA: Holliday junction branch migration protein RuvA [Coriobacteriia bacterium]